jgi:hypothetical protein
MSTACSWFDKLTTSDERTGRRENTFLSGETMTIDAWLKAAIADAERRGLPELKPMLETLARTTASLRAADFNDQATGGPKS